jgi:O-antigen ligase
MVVSTVAGAPRPKEERPARFHHPVNDVAGLLLLLVLGAGIGFELGRNPVPPLFVAAGCLGIVFMLGLAILRYDAAVAVGILLMPVVRQEPAPVDAVLAIVMAVTIVTNRLELRRVPLSMLTLISLFVAVNLLASMEAIESNTAAKFLATTAYCLFIGIWICGYVDRPQRARLVIKAYIISAVAIAAASTVALYVRYPGSDFLLSADFERARGFFKDANVYGPYLVPAAMILAGESIQPRLLKLNRPTQIFCFGFLAAGILFSFSRGAWLNLLVAIVVMTFTIALRRGGSRRAFVMLIVIIVGLGVTVWAVYASGSLGFLEERAKFQTYDSERFGAQRAGLELAQTHPIGIGPGQFELIEPLSVHSTYIRALAEEGIVGAAILFSLLFGTLLFAVRNAVLGRDTYGIGSGPLLASWCGMLVNSFVIDSLHWRYLWVLAGLIWAGAAATGVRAQLSSRVGRAAVR